MGSGGENWDINLGNALKDVITLGHFGRARDEKRAEEAVDAANKEQKRLTALKQEQDRLMDVNASKTAEGTRATTAARTNATTSAAGGGGGLLPLAKQPLGDEKDFLGV